MSNECPKCGSIKVNSWRSLIGVGAASEANLPSVVKKPAAYYCFDCGHLWHKKEK